MASKKQETKSHVKTIMIEQKKLIKGMSKVNGRIYDDYLTALERDEKNIVIKSLENFVIVTNAIEQFKISVNATYEKIEELYINALLDSVEFGINIEFEEANKQIKGKLNKVELIDIEEQDILNILKRVSNKGGKSDIDRFKEIKLSLLIKLENLLMKEFNE